MNETSLPGSPALWAGSFTFELWHWPFNSRKDRKMENIYYSSFNSALLRRVFVASTEKGVCAVDFFKKEKTFLKELRESFPGRIVRNDRKNRNVLNQLKKYLKGELQRFDCKLDFRGTLFQTKVWSALVKIPYGQTRSYGEIAQAIGHPKAFRAVGNANGRNSIPLIVPCHRVIGSDGGLAGFGHGVRVKKQLLNLEKGR
jgi:O-6-methylguanine DNA methyltransferase